MTMRRPKLSIRQILAWADFYHERTGRWPGKDNARFVYNAVGEKWLNIDNALRRGLRGLGGNSSLAQLLAERRGVRNIKALPPFRVGAILAWADAYYRRHGQWPKNDSGSIPEAPGEKWAAVDAALWLGQRGLPGRSSLARLLSERRGVRNKGRLPRFASKQILAWADAYHRRHRQWPRSHSGSIPEAPGETWAAVQAALIEGLRGLPGGSSLGAFLEHHRGVRNLRHLPHLTRQKILAWADARHRRTGKWPTMKSGAIAQAPGETWGTVGYALEHGRRGLAAVCSLAQLLEKSRGVPNPQNRPRLSHAEILRWADAFHRRTGKWPRISSGPISEAPHETWSGVNTALNNGLRGFPGGSTLAQLLSERRGVRNIQRLLPFSRERILAWADRYHRTTGRWPTARSGPIPGAPGETWQNVENALRLALRGLDGGSSLSRLLQKHGRTLPYRGRVSTRRPARQRRSHGRRRH